MSALSNVTKVGSAVEKFGHVLVPGSQTRARVEREATETSFQSSYLHGSDLYSAPLRTVEEARIANGRAIEAQREAVIIGRAVGGFVALGAALWFGRRGRR